MVNDYTLLKSLHVFLVVIWLGTDIITMASFYRLLDPKLAIKTRLGMSRLSDLMDMGPRSALVILLMLGLYLTYRGDWGLAGPVGAAIAWVASIVGLFWFAGVWHQFWVAHRNHGGPPIEDGHAAFQKRFRIADLWLRSGISGALALAALLSLFGAGPFGYLWLSIKLILFAGIVACGVYLRVLLPRIGKAVGGLIAKGSTPELEAALWAPSKEAIIAVWAIWILIAIMTWLAVAKPS